jgi:hypothetical protein
MAVEAKTVGDDKAQEQAWKDAGGDREGMPPPTGDAVNSADAEKDMIRGMQTRTEQPLEKQRAMLRGPTGAPQAENGSAAPARDESFTPPAENEPAPRREAPPAPSAAENEEGAALERQILGLEEPGGLGNDLPDTLVKVGGKEIPLSRIRDGLDALTKRDQWNAEYTQKQQQLARANDLMIDAAREFQRDPIGAAEKIGIKPERLAEELRARGLLDTAGKAAGAAIESLPDDADPTAKALYVENQELKRQNAKYDRDINGIKQTLVDTDQRTKAAALRQQHAAAFSGAKSEITAMVSSMPSMREAVGKPDVTGRAVIELTSLRLEQELAAYGQPVEAAQLRDRAKQILAEVVRKIGVTPKAQQARNALSRQRDPVPTRTGTTLPPTQAAAEKSKPGSIDFSNDDARRQAMDAWFEAHGAEA